MDYFAHQSSYIDEGAEIGKGTKIWHFSHVMERAQIGRNCTIGQNVFVGRNVKIGNEVKIQNNVSIYEGVLLEEAVFCGPSVVFTNVDTPRSGYPRNSSEYLRTKVKKGATIGANATVVCGHTIGAHAFVGAGSVITNDIPAYALTYGVPAQIHGWICECGERLEFSGDRAECKACGLGYKRDNSKVELVDGS